jgi:glycosyltransferase involved in cell wall biosynthesis
MTRPALHVDARMFQMSGIGTYLQNMLARLGCLTEKYEVNLHGPYDALEELALRTGIPYRIHALPVEPFALRQTLLPLGRAVPVRNLWVPHYNIPFRGYRKLVVTIHDVLHLRSDVVPRSILQRAFARAVFSQVRRRASHVVFDSRFTRDEFHATAGRPARETVLHIGVDDRWFDLDPATLPSPVEKPYLFFVGNLSKHKNLSSLLDAYLGLPDSYPYKLVLAGKMHGLRTMDSHPVLRGTESHPKVDVLGAIDQPTLEAHMLHARALVFPSVYEGFGLPPLEAMAAGTSVLCSDIPVFRELYGDIPGWFDPTSIESLRSKLLGLVESEKDDASSVRRLASKEHARSYRWEPVASRHAGILESVFGG